jgi:hypothetical protein
MPIRTQSEIKVTQYDHQQQFETQYIDGTPASQAYPLVYAAERDAWIDKVYYRALVTGAATTTITLKRSGTGVAGVNGTAMGTAVAASSVADDTTAEYVLYEDEAHIAEGTPRKLDAGDTLFVDFSAVGAGALDYQFYIRWRTNTE